MSVTEELESWFAKKVQAGWFEARPEIAADDDEILVTGTLAAPKYPKDSSPSDRKHLEIEAISAFREETREARMKVAAEAERLFNRKVSWAVTCGGSSHFFTGLSIPAMTRLRVKERAVLDTLIAAGVARSRSDALQWCVRLVASKQSEWLKDLREAFGSVEKVRAEGPKV